MWGSKPQNHNIKMICFRGGRFAYKMCGSFPISWCQNFRFKMYFLRSYSRDIGIKILRCFFKFHENTDLFWRCLSFLLRRFIFKCTIKTNYYTIRKRKTNSIFWLKKVFLTILLSKRNRSQHFVPLLLHHSLYILSWENSRIFNFCF
jgi:hypothetical protein